jgi:hypothetical protein
MASLRLNTTFGGNLTSYAVKLKHEESFMVLMSVTLLCLFSGFFLWEKGAKP